MRVIKIGGALLNEPDQVAQIGRIVAASPGGSLVVHGGGTAVDDAQKRLGIPIEKVDGLRRTGEAVREAVLMVLCGLANKQLVAALQAVNVAAVGLSGIDGGLFRCEPLSHPEADLGYVGEIVQVNTGILTGLLDQGFVPVVAPLSLGVDGEIYNVNADQAAAKLASALGAEALDLVSGVPGVEIDGSVAAVLSSSDVARLREAGAIHSGMVPKVEAGLRAVREGVGRVRITDVVGLEAIGGTELVADHHTRSEEESF